MHNGKEGADKLSLIQPVKWKIHSLMFSGVHTFLLKIHTTMPTSRGSVVVCLLNHMSDLS